MSATQYVGLVLLLAGFMDILLAFVVVGPRIPDPERRRIVQLSLFVGAAAMIGLGAALLGRMLG